jgi:tetratricopeptide (TPR) repeat protein
MQGDLSRAQQLAEAAISVAAEAGSLWDEGAAHTVLGIVANWQGDLERARYHHQRSIELAEELGVEPTVEKLNLSIVAMNSGDYDDALALLEDVLASRRRDENLQGMGYALLNLGLVHYMVGDSSASRRHFEEARACLENAGTRAQLAYALQGLAASEAREGRFEEAARLLGEARRELDDFGAPEDGFAVDLVADTKARAREALGDEAFMRLYAVAGPTA